MARTIKLAEYLFTRLRQLGVQSMYGVPGDYNLALLDYVEPSGLHWVGNCNELNAGYAADGYARIKGLSAMITTFGVGELSAVNAIAGAYAERAPIVHIVGTPSRVLQDSRAMVHHTFNDGDYRRFGLMHAHVTVAQTRLQDLRTSPSQIDHLIEQCLIHSRPVYIEVPIDMVALPVDASRLETPISIPNPIQPETEEEALSVLLDRIYTAERPMILVDGESHAFGIVPDVTKLIKTTKWPTFTTIFGKGLVDETLPNVFGVYTAGFNKAGQKEFVDSCDLILCFGPHFSSTNSYAFSAIPNPVTTISFGANEVKANKDIFRDLPARYIVPKLLSKLDFNKLKPHEAPTEVKSLHGHARPLPQVTGTSTLTQEHFYNYISPFFRPGDIILTETGTAGNGGRDFALQPHSFHILPVTWLSIGYMLPATLGAAVAQRELLSSNSYHGLSSGRTILFIGDGSLQMTVQEISTMIHEKLDILIFLINNDGYTIERMIWGRNQRYNDVARWRYLEAPSFFGADDSGDYKPYTASVRTWAELDEQLKNERVVSGKGVRIVELIMERMDAPAALHFLLQKQLDAEAQMLAKEKKKAENVNGEV